MNKEALELRIKEIEAELLKIVNIHTGLTGQLGEAKYWLENLARDVASTATPVVEHAVEELVGEVV